MGMYRGKAEKGFVQPITFNLASLQEPFADSDLPKIQQVMHMQMAANGFLVHDDVTEGNYESAICFEVVSATGKAQKMWLVVDNYYDVKYAHLEEISVARGNLREPWKNAIWMNPAAILNQICERRIHENASLFQPIMGTPQMILELQDFLQNLPWSPYLFHTDEMIFVSMSEDEEDILGRLASGEVELDDVEVVDDGAVADALADQPEHEMLSAVCWTLICGSQLYLTDQGTSLVHQPSQLVDMYLRRKELSIFQRDIVTVARH